MNMPNDDKLKLCLLAYYMTERLAEKSTRSIERCKRDIQQAIYSESLESDEDEELSELESLPEELELLALSRLAGAPPSPP